MYPTLITMPFVNLLGFSIGLFSYSLLLWMVIKSRQKAITIDNNETTENKTNKFLLVTGLLGLIWNFGGLIETLNYNAQNQGILLLLAFSYSALGFLPAVVVHTVNQDFEDYKNLKENQPTNWLIIVAYTLSTIAAVFHFIELFSAKNIPSTNALQLLTVGYLIVLGLLLVSSFRQSLFRKTLWVVALAVFTISALHLSRPHNHENFWLIEIIGHQSSLLLAFVIMYQNFRFAFVDVFLKRALSVFLTVITVFLFYWMAVSAFLPIEGQSLMGNSKFWGAILGLWILTPYIAPYLRKISDGLVNKIILARADYDTLRNNIKLTTEELDSPSSVLDAVCQALSQALTVENVIWQETPELEAKIHPPFVDLHKNKAELLIPTANQPFYKIILRNFQQGRRLLSDEIKLLDDVALVAARRIDTLRVTHERCEQELREQEFSNLATEAELRALRAQINPHFLFNTLTTIGYLIDAAPNKALATLLQLTQLLRGALRSNSEFLTLGEELKLIEAYLEIEQQRFEERLEIEIKVAPELHQIRVPSLILQPLVENAVKHGITPKKEGGKITILGEKKAQFLILKVIDTGIGLEKEAFAAKRLTRVGLNNVEQRLGLYYNGASSLEIESNKEFGTTVQIKISLEKLIPLLPSQRKNKTKSTTAKV